MHVCTGSAPLMAGQLGKVGEDGKPTKPFTFGSAALKGLSKQASNLQQQDKLAIPTSELPGR